MQLFESYNSLLEFHRGIRYGAQSTAYQDLAGEHRQSTISVRDHPRSRSSEQMQRSLCLECAVASAAPEFYDFNCRELHTGGLSASQIMNPVIVE